MPGSDIPSASTTPAIVEAVPSSLQWPADGINAASSSSYSSLDIRPAAVLGRVPPEIGPDAELAAAKVGRPPGPPVSMIAGTPALAAPISWAGTVLSQPASRTTASSGLARIVSSTSIAIRLR